MKKKIISVLLSTTMLCGPVGALAMPEIGTVTEGAQAIAAATAVPTTTAAADLTPLPTTTVTATPAALPTATPATTPAATPTAEPDEIKINTLSGEDAQSTELKDSLAEGNYTISTDGDYTLTDYEGSNAVTVGAGVTATLTIKNVSITGTSAAAPITVASTAKLTLVLEKNNTLASGANYYAGIAVNAASKNDGTSLTIEGDGSLAVTGKTHAPAIGTNKSNYGGSAGVSGAITINSGTVTATGGTHAAGIGGAQNSTACGDITINGGVITATGGSKGAGIGGGYKKANDNIYINGGTVVAKGGTNAKGMGGGNGATTSSCANIVYNGGSVSSEINGANVVDNLSNPLHVLTLTVPNKANATVSGSGWTAVTDSDAKFYPFVSDSATSYSITCGDTVYYTNITSGTTEYTLTEFSGTCTCTKDNTSIKSNIPTSVTVNKTEGEKSVNMSAELNPAENCDYPTHSVTVEYSAAIDGVAAEDLSDYLTISGNKLTVKYAAAGKTIKLTVNLTYKEFTLTENYNIAVSGDTVSRFDLTEGSITITSSQTDGCLTVKCGTTSYEVDAASGVYIKQSSASATDHTITVNTDANVTIDSLNVKTATTSETGSIIRIGEGVSLNLTLVGQSKFNAQYNGAISGNGSTSTLTVGGDGALTVTSGNNYAGIGPLKSLTVNGGYISATGGSGGAGIGGSGDGKGYTVTINGGKVYAYGMGGGAGIGGGGTNRGAAGGTFTINGGMVCAAGSEGESGTGHGIGSGALSSSGGTVTINGGSVNATFNTQPSLDNQTQYLVKFTLEGESGGNDIQYDVDGGSKISSSTDDDGLLYLYLKPGEHWIRVYKDAQTYYKYVKVTKDTSGTHECIKNPTAEITSFKILGQIGDTVIEDSSINVTVPYNIELSQGLKPIVEYKGCKLSPEKLSFDDNNTSTLSVVADDQTKKDYTVTLTLDGEPETPTADTFNIANGSISIGDDSVEYGGVTYKKNPLGYIITGTTTENTLAIDGENLSEIPIVFSDLNITNANQGSYPVSIYAGSDINITVSGECSAVSLNENAMYIEKYDGTQSINISSDDAVKNKLSLSGGSTCEAVDVGEDCTLKITGVSTEITGGGTANGIGGTGSFVTDSGSYMHVSQNEGISPKTADGNALYMAALKINADDKTVTTCTFNGTEYNVNSDAVLYVMLEADTEEKTYAVTYGKKIYRATVKVTEDTEIEMYTTDVTSVAFEKSFTYNGGTVTVTVDGRYVKDCVDVTLTPVGGTGTITAVQDDDNSTTDKAVLTATIPKNPSYDTPVVYKVSYSVWGDSTECTDRITVAANTSVAEITQFDIDGELSSTITTVPDPVVTILMPYDHEFQNYYTPSTIKYIGYSVDPRAGMPKQYTKYSDYTQAVYTVTANDKETKVRYYVKIRKDPTPKAKQLSFTSRMSCEGGDLKVKVTGTALSSVPGAEKEDNRKVWIYSDDGIEAVLADYTVESNGSYSYSATVKVPENTSDTTDDEYELKVKIGDVEQTISTSTTLTVSRRSKSNTNISEFTLENQVGETEIIHDEENGSRINITMPYDSDITSLSPSVVLSDLYSSYAPLDLQDFTNDVVYTITAEDGVTTEDYTVHVTKQNVPTATSIDFTDTMDSGGGRVTVTINGTDLENALNSVNEKTIAVSGTMIEGEGEGTITSGIATLGDDGVWTAVIIASQNNDSDNPKKYALRVTVNGVVQTLTGNTTLTVSRKNKNEKKLSDFKLTDNDKSVFISSDNRVSVKVPYNTDLSSLAPTLYHTGDHYTPTGPQDFNSCPVQYDIYAEDGTYNSYYVYVTRDGSAGVTAVELNDEPQTFKECTVTFDVTGEFIPDDLIVAYLIPDDSKGEAVPGTNAMVEGSYAGHMTISFDIPTNDSLDAKTYSLGITSNGNTQTFGNAGKVTMPRRTPRTVTSFEIDGQTSSEITEDDADSGTIVVSIPYETEKITTEPKVRIDGDAYTIEGELSFYSNATCTVTAADDTPRTYTIKLVRDGEPKIEDVTVSQMPSTFKGGEITVGIDGVFYDSAKVTAKTSEGTPVTADMTVDKSGHATATISLPTNYNTEKQEYVLSFEVDGFEVEHTVSNEVAVPGRTTRTITEFEVEGQTSSEITETDENSGEITVLVPYNIEKVTAPSKITIDGDEYKADNELSFYRDTTYTVTAADDTPRTYTVKLLRDGKPQINSVRLSSMPPTFKGGNITVDIDGIFYDSAEVTAVDESGGAVKAQMNVDKSGHATATFSLPTNYSTEKKETYTLSFNVDGFATDYVTAGEVSVPRKTTRIMTSFSLPEIQEGETIIDGTDITVTVPYNTDLTAVTATMEYDADSVSPTGAQDFSNDEKPVTYTLSSADDEDVTYTVHIVKNGVSPRITSFTVPNQKDETVYEGDTIYIRLGAGSDIKELTPEIVTTQNATYSPTGAQDFSRSKTSPLEYIVTNQYGVSKSYYVTVEKPSGGSSAPQSGSSPIKISFTDEEKTVNAAVGDKITLSPTVSGTKITPSYMTSDSSVATVDKDGVVTVVGEGTAEITAYIYSIKATVTVNATAAAPTPTVEPTASPSGGNERTEKAYVLGYEDGTFRPDAYITRAEAAVITSRVFGSGVAGGTSAYSDVPSDSWYADSIAYLSGAGIFTGYEDGTFRPDAYITRAELCAVIARAAAYDASDADTVFADVEADAPWAKGYIAALYGKGYISGYEDGLFRPNAYVTRAETVKITDNFVEGDASISVTPTDVSESHWAYNEIVRAMNERVVSEN